MICNTELKCKNVLEHEAKDAFGKICFPVLSLFFFVDIVVVKRKGLCLASPMRPSCSMTSNSASTQTRISKVTAPGSNARSHAQVCCIKESFQHKTTLMNKKTTFIYKSSVK